MTKPIHCDSHLGAEDSAIASRHRSDLVGAFYHLEEFETPHVVISVSPLSARTYAGQCLAVHVANLVGRLAGVISSISCEADRVELMRGVQPRGVRGEGLRESMERAATM